MSVSLCEVLDKLQVLVVLYWADCVLDHLQKVWNQVQFLDSWNEVLITCYCLESIDRLEGDCFVLAKEIDTFVKEKDGVSEGILILLVQDINEISQEEAVSYFDKLAFIVDDFLNIVGENFLDCSENVCISLLRVDITQQPEDCDWCINDYIWSWILDEWTAQVEVPMDLLYVGCEVLEDQGLFLTLFAKSHVEWLDAEIAGKGDRAVDVVAKCFK